MRPRLIGLCIIAVGICAQVDAAEHTKDSLEKVKKNVKERKAVLVDVREESEWEDGHIRGASHLPLSWLAKSPDRKELQKKLPKGKVLYVHCKSGGRCLIAADLLKEFGYDLRPLKAGYTDLIKAGFEKAEEKRGKQD